MNPSLEKFEGSDSQRTSPDIGRLKALAQEKFSALQNEAIPNLPSEPIAPDLKKIQQMAKLELLSQMPPELLHAFETDANPEARLALAIESFKVKSPQTEYFFSTMGIIEQEASILDAQESLALGPNSSPSLEDVLPKRWIS